VITGFKKMITSIGIGKKDITDAMKGRLMDTCPLSSSFEKCHPSCNWWSEKKCTHPLVLYKKHRRTLRYVKVDNEKDPR